MLLRVCAALKRPLFLIIACCYCAMGWARELAIVEVLLNTQSQGEYFLIMTEDGDILFPRRDLNTLPLRTNLGTVPSFEDGENVSLRSIEGLEFELDPASAQLIITADAKLFKPNSADIGFNYGQVVATPAVNSAFLNYALSTDSIDGADSSELSLELGGRTRELFGLSTFNYQRDENSEQFVRLMTSIRHDDRSAMTTLSVGDHLAQSASVLGSTVVLGGINFSRNFSVAPYYSTSPALQMRGMLQTPSTLEVYSNGYRVDELELPPGEFELNDIPSRSGLGNTEVVIRDAYGRESVISEEHYYSQILLRKGLADYSHSIGFIREDLGKKSANYDKLAITSRYFQGLSRQHTLGYTLGAARQHINLAPTFNTQFSRYGTLGMSLEASHSERRSGYGAALDYNLHGRRMSLNASYRTLSKHYANLTLGPNTDKPAALFNLSSGINIKGYGSLSLRYANSRYYQNANSRHYGVFYNHTLSRQTHLFVSTLRNRTDGDAAHNEYFIGLHISIDPVHSANLGYTRREDGRVKQAQLQRALPSDSGGGYTFQVEEDETDTQWQSNGIYQNNIGRYEARFYNSGDLHASAAGGIGYIDKSWFLSRPINDSFAKIKTGDLDDVAITYFGNEVVRSNRKGEAIIPVIRSFHNNRIGLVESDIPIDFSVASLSHNVNPEYRAGVVLDFGLQRFQAFTGKLFYDTENGEQPLEFAVLQVPLASRTLEGLVGRGGEFYLENIPPGQHRASVQHQGRECSIELDVPANDEMLIDLGKLSCEL